MRARSIIIGLIVLNSLVNMEVQAQDAQFSQVYSAPLYLNPALCGDTYQDRAAMIYRKQWASVPGSFASYAASYDHRFVKSNTAFGITALRDQAGIQGLRLTDFAAHYSYGLSLAPLSGLRIGMRVGHSTREHDLDNLLFWDQVVRGDAPQSIESGLQERVSYLDAGAGLLYYTARFWGGLSVMHLNRPNYSLMGSDLQVPIRYSIHAGGSIPLSPPLRRSSAPTLDPVVHFKKQEKWSQLDIGAYYSKDPYMIGVWYRGIPISNQEQGGYRGHEAIILLAGVELDSRFRLGYSYDFTISRLAGSTGGSHELSFIYEWPNSKMKNRKQPIPCPRF